MEYNEARIEAFKSKIAQLEKQIEDLNFVMTMQEQELLKLKDKQWRENNF